MTKDFSRLITGVCSLVLTLLALSVPTLLTAGVFLWLTQ